MTYKKNPTPEHVMIEQQQKMEQERKKLIVQSVKLPNGAIFTRLKPVGAE